MNRPRRLILPIVLLALGLGSAVLPGRAQQGAPARFAFADTTLLRDTLDLSFERLFPLADSLRVTPDTLRALSIRYVMSLERMVFLADSLRMPVDSVGVIMERERFNPLAVVENVISFGYNSSFTVGRRSQTWSNGSDYNLARGPLFLRNVTRIGITRTEDGALTDRHETRSSNTELGWRFSPNASIGARANLQRTDNFKPGSIYNSTVTTNQFQFSVRTRQRPLPGLNSEINVFGGPFDEPRSNPQKRGIEGQVDARASYEAGNWLNHDLNVQGSIRNGRGRLPNRDWLDTQDLTGNLIGSLNLFPAGAFGGRIAYTLSGDQIERPDTLTTADSGTPVTQDAIVQNPSGGRSIEVGTRLRDARGNYLDVTQSFSNTRSLLAVSRGGRFVSDQTRSEDERFRIDGRYSLHGWLLDMQFSNGHPSTESPRRTTLSVEDTTIAIDYRERQALWNRSINATLSTNLTRQLALVVTANVSLSSFRYSITDSAYRVQTGTARVSSTDPRDDYRQSWQIEALYNRSAKVSTALALQVSLNRTINLLSSRSSSNRDDRVYRAEWRWNYRMMKGLTATQRNQIIATYTSSPFDPESNRLGLDYLTITTLNAVISPRFSIDLTHNARYQPSGDYVRSFDGENAFNQSDESRDYSLSGRISYRPMPAFSLSLQPFYQSSNRDGTVSGQPSPISRRKTLNFTGSANLNLRLGSRARLTGNIGRTFQSNGSTSFNAGQARQDPVYETDYWNGTLQLSWNL